MSATLRALVPQALTAEAFAEFGDVVEVGGSPDLINDGTTQQFADLSGIDTGIEGGRPCVSIYRATPYPLPLAIRMLERHPLGSQLFMPLSGEVAEELSGRLLRSVEAFHAAQPLAAGMGREALRGKLPPVADPRLFQRILSQLVERGALVLEGDQARRAEHAAASSASGGALKDEVARAIQRGGLAPPWIAELPGLVKASPSEVGAVLKLLLADGKVVRVSSELYFDAAAVAGLRERLVGFLRERRSITTQEFKDLVGATRKHVIPLGLKLLARLSRWV